MTDEEIRGLEIVESDLLAGASPELRKELERMNREVIEFSINVQRLLTEGAEPQICYVMQNAARAAHAARSRREIMARLAARYLGPVVLRTSTAETSEKP